MHTTYLEPTLLPFVRRQKYFKADIVACLALSGINMMFPRILNSWSFGENHVQTESHFVLSALYSITFFNLASTLSSFVPFNSAATSILLSILHIIFAGRSFLMYSHHGFTMGFMLSLCYNLYIGASLAGNSLRGILNESPDVPVEKSKKNIWNYEVQTAILYGDIIPQALFGLFLFYNNSVVHLILPLGSSNKMFFTQEEQLLVSNLGLLIISNAAIQFAAIVGLDYTSAMSSAVSHIGSALISIWFMFRTYMYNQHEVSHYMKNKFAVGFVLWTLFNLIFALFIYNQALVVERREVVVEETRHEIITPEKKVVIEYESSFA
ncbi:hypothetical protein AKO1_007765 [Acrasis kona]|uniref:Uncharacterized protein n=1 Tax=Acrasis kona TaxID=1008807 RepID=A0AAW2YQQ4_9EUKA